MTANQRLTAGYVAPFAVFVASMVAERTVFHSQHLYAVRLVLTIATIAAFSWPFLSFRPSRPLCSVALGLAVFALWIAPDLLFGYRHHWLFENSLLGSATSTLAPGDQTSVWFLTCRAFGSTILVPIFEELFWRGWLMRWMIRPDFASVPLGAYAPVAFWGVAAMFAVEHGPYWEVGLIAGVAYNWWIVRTRNLADCMLAHSVTNGALAVYVVSAGAWRYWL